MNSLLKKKKKKWNFIKYIKFCLALLNNKNSDKRWKYVIFIKSKISYTIYIKYEFALFNSLENFKLWYRYHDMFL